MIIINNIRNFSNIRGGVNPPKKFVSKYAFAFTTDQVAPLSVSHIVGTQVRNIVTGEVVYTATTLNNGGTRISSALPVGQYEIINPNPTTLWLYGTGVISVDDWGDIDADIHTHIRLQGCTRLTSVPNYLPHSITDMSNMFYKASSFNSDISNWDISNVTDMNSMFYNATSFNSDISSWNTTKVIYMQGMFYNATTFNQNLSTWKVPKIASKPKSFDTNTPAWVKTNRQPLWGVA